MLDIALLKRNHPYDRIETSFEFILKEEQSETSNSKSLTIHFITNQHEEGVDRLYYNQVFISAKDYDIIKATGAKLPQTKSEVIERMIENNQLKKENDELKKENEKLNYLEEENEQR